MKAIPPTGGLASAGHACHDGNGPHSVSVVAHVNEGKATVSDPEDLDANLISDTSWGTDDNDGDLKTIRQNGHKPVNVIITAPDYATFVKPARTSGAKAYETKVQSMLKTITFGSLRRNDARDAAALLHYGPDFASAAGDLADKNERVARMIDMLTTPDNPYFAFAIAGLGLAGQLFRNHEDRLQTIPEAVKEGWRERRTRKQAEANGERAKRTLDIKLPFGRMISVGIGFKFPKLRWARAMFKIQTRNPDELTNEVFSDDKLIKALARENIHITRPDAE